MNDYVFLDWKYDVGFKWIFGREGREKNFLGLVKSIAQEVGSELIKLDPTSHGLTFLNVERWFQQDVKFRKILYDILVKLPDENRIILEMQKKNHRGLGVRVFDYIIKSVKEHENKNHILIAFMNFNYNLWGNKANTNMVKNLFFVNQAEIITVELVRFNKNLNELNSELDYWLYLFNNISKLKEVPEIFIGTPFENVIEMSRISALPKPELELWKKELEADKILREAYELEVEEAVREIVDQRVEEASAKSFKEGAEYGKEQGLEQGQNLKLQQIIAQLQAKGLSNSEIASLLNIDAEDL
jgi:predicted transposase/invertase (TIGR01784 family)